MTIPTVREVRNVMDEVSWPLPIESDSNELAEMMLLLIRMVRYQATGIEDNESTDLEGVPGDLVLAGKALAFYYSVVSFLVTGLPGQINTPFGRGMRADRFIRRGFFPGV